MYGVRGDPVTYNGVYNYMWCKIVYTILRLANVVFYDIIEVTNKCERKSKWREEII